MSSTRPHDINHEGALNATLCFEPGIVATVFLFMLTQSAVRATTRACALDALLAALRPILRLAVDRMVPDALRDLTSDGMLVDIAADDLRRILPTLRIASAEDLLVRVANRAAAVVTGAVPMAPRPTSATVGHTRHLLAVLPTHVTFALLSDLYPALDARMTEVVVRMSHDNASWENTARALGTSADALHVEYVQARAVAEDRIVHEITRRQPWPAAATARITARLQIA